MQFAPPITLDEMAVISLHALGESSDSNVRFCLAEFRGCPGRKANIQIFGASALSNSGCFGGPTNIDEFTTSLWISVMEEGIQYPF